jgi:TonB family protein
MISLIDFLTQAGNFTLEHIWTPLTLWTILSLPVIIFLRKYESISAVYQYHLRVALLLTLPVSITASQLIKVITESMSSPTAVTKLLVLPNLVTITATSKFSSTTTFAEPVTWIGIAAVLILAGTGYFLANMISDFLYLRKLDDTLDFRSVHQDANLMAILPEGINQDLSNTKIAFSSHTNIPFTYGWRLNRIVIPEKLKENPTELAMVLEHELMHIRNNDFLLNSILTAIEALFWFHPFTHYLHKTSKEYREIICDITLLANSSFSKKQYASLLFKIAQQKPSTTLAMNMAVKQSSLKKRIKTMSEQTYSSMTFRYSFLGTFIMSILMVLAIGCSDIGDNGITQTEFQEAQSQLAEQQTNSNVPLYVLDGEVMTKSTINNSKFTRIKPKYIKSVNVLKGQDAADKYGKSGLHGVIEIEFLDDIDKQTVFTDLKENSGASGAVPPSPQEEKDYFISSVDKMPTLKGGLAQLQKQITYPKLALQAGLEGKVVIQFIVNKQGKVEHPHVVKGIGGGCDEEALRVVKKATFTPGIQDGEPVRVQYAIPILYKLSSEQKG